MSRKSLQDLLNTSKNDPESTNSPDHNTIPTKELTIPRQGLTKSDNQQSNISNNKFIKSIENGKVNINAEELRKCNIFFATPCYGGMVTDQFFLSMFRTSQKLAQLGINFRITTLRNESLIPRGRNILNAMFLASECTHLMFIDADIEFDSDSIIRMLAMDKHVIAGAYPKKTINWGAIKEQARLGNIDNLENYQADYAINLKIIDKTNNKVNVDHGCIEVLDASTGFLLIKRETMDEMIENYPELSYVNDSNIDPSLHKYCYSFFDTMLDPQDRRYLSEDYTFCRRWQSLGGKIWLDPETKLNHVGSCTFKGQVSNLFEGKK